MIEIIAEALQPSPRVEPAGDGGDYVVDVVDRVDGAWDRLIAQFSDASLEQTAGYMLSRWGDSRLCGLLLRGAMSGEPEAAALAVIAALPLVKLGLAYVKFGPVWRRKDRAVQPSVLAAALSAVSREFSGLRGLLTRVMPPAEPELAAHWDAALRQTGFQLRHRAAHPERYLVDLSLPEHEQLASLDAKWRANLRKASPAIDVREADPLASLPTFIGLYEAMRRRKHFADHHRIDRLPRLLAAASPALQPRLFLAYANGNAIAGSLVLGCGERVFVPYSASLTEALPLRAGYALRWELIRRLRSSQARWLDLGGDEGDRGLRHFKSGNAGRRGSIIAIPGEFDFAGSRLSGAAASALRWAHNMSRAGALNRLTHRR